MPQVMRSSDGAPHYSQTNAKRFHEEWRVAAHTQHQHRPPTLMTLIAYFNYSDIPTVVAVARGNLLERAAIPRLLLLLGLILIGFLLTFIVPSIIPKWAVFAPVFIPIFLRLGIGPHTLLATYRIGDLPVNMLTLAQRYRKNAGLGTMLSLMLPCALIMLAAWMLLFALWCRRVRFVLGIPLGPGYPVRG